MINRAYRYRLYPNDKQKNDLAKVFGTVRYAYNWALNLRTNAYFKENKSINFNESARLWTIERNSKDFLQESSSVPQQQALRHLQSAFVNFFQKTSKYPKFKKKKNEQKATFQNNAYHLDKKNKILILSSVTGNIKIRWRISKTIRI
jgi:putative transposase